MQSIQKSLNIDYQAELSLFNDTQWETLACGFVMLILYTLNVHTESY